MPQNATTDDFIKKMFGVLIMIGDLPLGFNTDARALAQEIMIEAAERYGVKLPAWRFPLDLEQRNKILRRSSLVGGDPPIQPKGGTMEEKSGAAPAVNIEMIPVESSNVAAVGHDGADVLRAEYKNGGVYEWRGITPSEFVDLVRAESPGRTLKASTANRGIKATKIGGGPA